MEGDSKLLISVYAQVKDDVPQGEDVDHRNGPCLGRAFFTVDLQRQNEPQLWAVKLETFPKLGDSNSAELPLTYTFAPTIKKTIGLENFDKLGKLGQGTYGEVFQVRKRDSQQIYAMKVLSKKVIVRNMEVDYAFGERNILIRNSTAESPFLLRLKFAFQTPSDLYLVTD